VSEQQQQSNSNLILGGYNNLSFYQSPSFLQNPDNQNNKPLIQSNLMNYEYNKAREQQQQQMDLIGKMHMTKQSQDMAQASAMQQSKMMHHQQFPYK
jgi:hypothetical protein